MPEIKCTNCGKIFTVDESGYAAIAKRTNATYPPRNELQYITDRIPAYVALRELKGDVKSTALQWLLARLEKL